MSWNVWSVLNEEKLNNLLQILDDRQIGIACITETWFDRKSGTFSKAIREAGYKLHHSFREDKRGGGCAIMYRTKLAIKKGKASKSEYGSFEYACVHLAIKS